ncbi:MAG TPA: prephenate dehydrogenase/arogenate dehydrogenase family protein, partial [Acidisarcina sp.]
AERAARCFNGPGQAGFLPGHPMAGKESSGAAHSDGELFRDAVWLFTPADAADLLPHEAEWREWVGKFGSRIVDLDPARHDELCAWVSHLPQMVATALSALLQERFASDERMREDMRAIGGRALREMTRLGASPYSMWRDIAHSNSDAVGAAVMALEQTLTHLRENLKTPELRELFEAANAFLMRDRLDHPANTQKAGLAERIMAIGNESAARLTDEERSVNHADLLYDEDGLPR